jgi:hypothetical protein
MLYFNKTGQHLRFSGNSFKFLVLLLFFSMQSSQIFAGTTGKIKGKITDKETRAYFQCKCCC